MQTAGSIHVTKMHQVSTFCHLICSVLTDGLLGSHLWNTKSPNLAHANSKQNGPERPSHPKVRSEVRWALMSKEEAFSFISKSKVLILSVVLVQILCHCTGSKIYTYPTPEIPKYALSLSLIRLLVGRNHSSEKQHVCTGQQTLLRVCFFTRNFQIHKCSCMWGNCQAAS